MKVKTRPAPETLASLLAREQDVSFDDSIEPSVEVKEMVFGDEAKLSDFGFPTAVVGRAKMVREEAGDEDPQFVVVRTEEGESLSGRLYDGQILESIAEQITAKEPVGHLGHIADHEIATAFPEPQTKWLGAVVRTEPSKLKDRLGQMVKVIYTAGYNLKDAKIRGYLKTGVVNSTSWQGKATQQPIPGRGVKILSFVLDSLDWSRKGAEGMPTARVVALAREMQTKEGKTHMDDGKDLAQVTPAEFKEANPNGYALLVSECTTESDKVIAEMQANLEAAKADKSLLDEIRKTLKLNEDANPLEKIAALVTKLSEKAKTTVNEALDALLLEKVPDEETRKLVKRLLPVPAMEMKAEDLGTAEEVTTLVSEMTEAAFNADEVIQTYVSEQAAPIVRRREELKGNTKVDYDALGMRRERRSVGA